jgi:prepilin-type N-terminal cleavage/methylation domain-containing protein
MVRLRRQPLAHLLLRAPETGFTLLEVLVALVILAIAVMGFQTVVTDRLVRTTGQEDLRAVASQLARDRLAQIQLDPVYTTLEARYEGTENPVAADPRFVRTTTITPSSNPSVNGSYLTVTVRAWSAQQGDTASRTSIIGAP